MSTQTATEILDRLSAAEIEARLEELDREARALRVLLRATRQRRPRSAPHTTAAPAEEVPPCR